MKKEWERNLNWLINGQELNDTYKGSLEDAINNLDELLRRYYKNKPGQGIKTDLPQDRG